MVTQTTNHEINHVEPNQNQKTVTINEAFDILDGVTAGSVSVDLAGESGDVTPSEASMRRALLIKTTGAMSAAVNLIVPDKPHGYWIAHNATGFDLTVKTASGTGVTISPTEAQLMYCDGTNVEGIGISGGSGAAKPTAPSRTRLTGAGALTDVSIGINVDPNVIEVHIAGQELDLGVEYEVIESSPSSGNYDTLSPLVSDIFPSGSTIVVKYYMP